VLLPGGGPDSHADRAHAAARKTALFPHRQEAKDRLRSEQDYRVNLKAELEIRHLHEKIDHLLSRQWERLGEIQEIQMELMTELANKPG
jgi:uncharacterized membrane protein